MQSSADVAPKPQRSYHPGSANESCQHAFFEKCMETVSDQIQHQDEMGEIYTIQCQSRAWYLDKYRERAGNTSVTYVTDLHSELMALPMYPTLGT